MPRSPRYLFSQSYYHIITRGNNRNIIFQNDQDYYYYLNLIARYKKELSFELYHYCLMPNHVHFLIKTKKAGNFSKFMKKLNLAYFHYYKNHYGWIGHFWQDRFRSQPVGKDEYFLQCGKYIELNPVRANIVDKPEKYKFSSFQHYIIGKKDRLISDDFIYKTLSRDRKKRQLLYKKLVIDELVESTYNKSVWGSIDQRHREKQKINRKLKKAKVSP